jgi:murein DD-endopeptidase MepM/ murein hydrolase activator NlpD
MGNHRADRRGPQPAAALDPTPAATTRGARSSGGKRKATKHRRAANARVLPSAPTVVGAVAILAAAGGAVAFGQGQLPSGQNITLSAGQSDSLNGTDAFGFVANDARAQAISRDTDRQAQAEAADKQLKAALDEQSQQRSAQLAQLALSAQKRADQIAKNLWVLPTTGYHLTGRFGQSSGLWAHLHTGLDFAAPTGTPIVAVANGVITETGYDGAYGNKTVETLPDGTEIWYCHQSTIGVSVGQKVIQSEQIGTIGSTGNTTGPHVHIEVRPGGGDPVDPYPEFVLHGVTP